MPLRSQSNVFQGGDASRPFSPAPPAPPAAKGSGASTQFFSATFILDGVVLNPPEFEGVERPTIPILELPGDGGRLPRPPPPPPSFREPPSRQPPFFPIGSCPALLGLSPLVEPSFSSVAGYSQDCFELAGATDWPASTCAAVCLPSGGVSPSSCPPLYGTNTPQADALVQAVLPHDAWVNDPAPVFLPGWSFVPAAAGLSAPMAIDRSTIANNAAALDFYNLVFSAIELLLDNLDLVRWSCCKVEESLTLAPALVDEPVPFNPFEDVNNPDFLLDERFSSLWDCVQTYLTDGFDVYFVDRLEPQGSAGASTGAATDPFFSEVPGITPEELGFRPGVILPFHNQNGFINSVMSMAFAQGGPSAPTAMAVIAGVVLHELVHLCYDNEWDVRQCFQPQNMLAMTFGWALAQRFGCFDDPAACATKFGATHYMSSEPDGVDTLFPFGCP